jgi:hypothetical protein
MIPFHTSCSAWFESRNHRHSLHHPRQTFPVRDSRVGGLAPVNLNSHFTVSGLGCVGALSAKSPRIASQLVRSVGITNQFPFFAPNSDRVSSIKSSSNSSTGFALCDSRDLSARHVPEYFSLWKLLDLH